MHHPTDRRAHTTAFVTPVVEHWLKGEIVEWRIDPTTHHTTLVQKAIHLQHIN